MKIIISAVVWIYTVPALTAQVPDPDMRCLLVAHGFNALSKTDAQKRAASLSEAFYLGRVSARMSATAMQSAIRSQGKGVAVQQAGKIMAACAAQAERANSELQTASRLLATRK